MFSIFKDRVTSELPNIKDIPVVGSKKVHLRVEETYEVVVPITASLQEFEQARRHLHVFAAEIGYPDVKVQERRGEGEIVLWFNGSSKLTGLDYNKRVFSNITWVEDLL